MRDALVFTGGHSLSFREVRTNIVRIPEVTARLREAQTLWDWLHPERVDLLNFLTFDDELYSVRPELGELAGLLVQLGLYDRYLKAYSRPLLLGGFAGYFSAARVALGQISLAEVIGEMPNRSSTRVADKVCLYRRYENDEYAQVKPQISKFEGLLGVAAEEADRLIVLGPGHADLKRNSKIVEFLAIDPELQWFWPKIAGHRLAIAN